MNWLGLSEVKLWTTNTTATTTEMTTVTTGDAGLTWYLVGRDWEGGGARRVYYYDP
jgi:hypothetical protein